MSSRLDNLESSLRKDIHSILDLLHQQQQMQLQMQHQQHQHQSQQHLPGRSDQFINIFKLLFNAFTL
jgi:hypothetical protein